MKVDFLGLEFYPSMLLNFLQNQTGVNRNKRGTILPTITKGKPTLHKSYSSFQPTSKT